MMRRLQHIVKHGHQAAFHHFSFCRGENRLALTVGGFDGAANHASIFLRHLGAMDD